jgi:osmotically inducible protein OsmC
MSMERSAKAVWEGTLRDGNGTFSVPSGAFQNVPYTFASRFESGRGSNPEELIAAAHAACFSMALSKILMDRGLTPSSISTTATVTVEKKEDGFAITMIHLETEGDVDGISESQFREAAETAKDGCPVSKLLAPGLDSLTFESHLKKPSLRA